MAINFANNSSLANITALPGSITSGALTLVSSQTASASASIEFSMDSTYNSYVFKFINIHPQTDTVYFQMNLSTDGGSTYNVTKTTTFFRAQHLESGAASVFEYVGSEDLAQSTSVQVINNLMGADADQNVSGYMQIFNPSSTTYVKHFLSVVNSTFTDSEASANLYMAGYGNTTSAINSIKFEMSSGNIDDGIIKMYGVS